VGNTTSGQSVRQALKDLLKVKGIGLKKETLENFLKAFDQVAPWFPVSGHLTGPSWGKLGKDLKFAEEQGVLVKGMQLVESVFKGPLPPNTVGLLLGRSSVTLQGLAVYPEVIDSDYTGQVKIMVSSPRGIVAISPGDRIAHLLLLPSCHSKFPANDKERGNRGFGSTGATSIYYSTDFDERPLLVLQVEGKAISGLLDTGTD
jgi:dUTPase